MLSSLTAPLCRRVALTCLDSYSGSQQPEPGLCPQFPHLTVGLAFFILPGVCLLSVYSHIYVCNKHTSSRWERCVLIRTGTLIHTCLHLVCQRLGSWDPDARPFMRTPHHISSDCVSVCNPSQQVVSVPPRSVLVHLCHMSTVTGGPRVSRILEQMAGDTAWPCK